MSATLALQRARLRHRSNTTTMLCAIRWHVTTTGGKRTRRVYLIAGEVSGDAIGAKLMKALPKQTAFAGVGGIKMEEQGLKSLFPMEDLSVMGITRVLLHLPRLWRRLRQVTRDIAEFKPDVVVAVDSKGFSRRVFASVKEAKVPKGHRPKLVQYVAPSSWAFGLRESAKPEPFASLVDHMLVLLPFEKIWFGRKGMRNTFVGYSALEDFFDAQDAQNQSTSFWEGIKLEESQVESVKMGLRQTRETLERHKIAPFSPLMPKEFYGRDTQLSEAIVCLRRHQQQLFSASLNAVDRKFLRESLEFPTARPVLALLPGSREMEVEKHLPLMLEALEKLSDSVKSLQFALIAAPSVERKAKAMLQQSKKDLADKTIVLSTRETSLSHMARAFDYALACSGTAVIECALAGLPTVCLYKGDPLTAFIARRKATVNYVSLPNLMLNRPLIPELLFEQCTADAIANNLSEMIHSNKANGQNDTEAIKSTLLDLVPWQVDTERLPTGEVRHTLRPLRPSEVSAEAIMKLIEDAGEFTGREKGCL